MTHPHLIAAVGTPLNADDSLHEEGLEAHLADQWRAGIDGVLVAGTMGFMQMLRDSTYQQLVRRSSEMVNGQGEVLVGIGDTSLGRTLDRLAYVQQFDIDGAVVLPPTFVKLDEPELATLFRAIADASKVPVYLYDLPPLIGRSFSIELVLEMAKHPNIKGIKCSGAPDLARQLLDLVPGGFRVVMAQPVNLDLFVHGGVREHLDGMYALAPDWARQIADAAASGNFDAARQTQQLLSELLRVLRGAGVGGAFTALLNARGIPGIYAPRPLPPLSEAERDRLMQHDVVQQLLQAAPKPSHA